MKFISKSSNLLVVLKPGLSAQPITGTPALPTVSVRFKDGMAEVVQDELITMMLNHPGFNSDFISAEDAYGDPYAASREESEPAHVVTELKHGTPVSRKTHGPKEKLPDGMQKLVQETATELAKEMAKDMLPGMVKETLKAMAAEAEEENKTETEEEPAKKEVKAKTAKKTTKSSK